MRALLLIATIAAIIAALCLIAPQPRAERTCDERRANPTFSEFEKGECRGR